MIATSSREGTAARRGRIATALAAVALTVALARPEGAAAQDAPDCSPSAPCVMLIQVAGLEPKDVTPQTTPFMWGLAHPGAATQSLGQRAGFIWQAARASMSAGLAANTAALLTGGYPEQSGIPADEFVSGGDRVRLGAPEGNAFAAPITAQSDLDKRSLFELIASDTAYDRASIVGDPALAELAAVASDVGSDDRVWFPSPNESPDGTQGNPAYCPPPRDPTVSPDSSQASKVGCPAADGTTLNQAAQIFNAAGSGDLGFTFIHLAELGAIKRQSSDVDGSPADQNPDDPTSVAAALAQTDGALATFFNQIAQNNAGAQRLGGTIVMIVGSSGYEQTLPDRRVPSPNGSQGEDLEDFVEQSHSDFTLVPQGTMATVYCSVNCPEDPAKPGAAYRGRLAQLKAEIENVDAHEDCARAGGCIAEVLYVRDELAPKGSDETVEQRHRSWRLDHQKLNDEFEPTGPTGIGGELVVTTRRGWATGKAVPAATDLEGGDGGEIITNPYQASTGGPRNRAVAAIINGPAGGGDANAVRQYSNPASGNRYPVTESVPEIKGFIPECPANPDPAFGADGLGPANASPGDDADDGGNLCQAETVDFAPTIAALLGVAMPPEQLAGRPLNEAFRSPLTLLIDVPPPPPPPIAFFLSGPISGPDREVNKKVRAQTADSTPTFEFDSNILGSTIECQIDEGPWFVCSSPYTIEPPLEPGSHSFSIRATGEGGTGEIAKAFFEIITVEDYTGLARDLEIEVTDRKGRSYRAARPGAKFSHIRIKGEFGRRHTLTTLTFYHRESKRKRCKGPTLSDRCKVTTIAGFAPFEVGKGKARLKLKVPKRFRGKDRPDFLGLFLEEARPASAQERSACEEEDGAACEFVAEGLDGGAILKIKGAARLHKRKCRGNAVFKKGKCRKAGKGKGKCKAGKGKKGEKGKAKERKKGKGKKGNGKGKKKCKGKKGRGKNRHNAREQGRSRGSAARGRDVQLEEVSAR